MLASLAAAPLLVRPALAEEADAVDSAVDSLTSVIKVRLQGCHPVAAEATAAAGPECTCDPQSMFTLPVGSPAAEGRLLSLTCRRAHACAGILQHNRPLALAQRPPWS
jgi:hypothetical protein